MNNRRIRKLPQRAGKNPDADAVRGESLDFVDLASRHRQEEDRKELDEAARAERLQRLREGQKRGTKQASVAHEVTNPEAAMVAEAAEVEGFEADQHERRIFSTPLQQEVASLNEKRIRWFERGGALVAVGALVLGFILLLVYISKTDRNVENSAVDDLTVQADPALDYASYLSNARRVSREFVLAKSMGERLKYVRYPGKVAELMLKEKSMNWDAPLPFGEVQALENPIYEEPFFLGCYVELDPTKIYDLEFQSVQSEGDLISEGRNLIVIATVNDRLHVRIFAADGGLLADKGERELAAGVELLNLKDEMRSMSVPDVSELDQQTKNVLMKHALFAAGISESRRYPIEVEVRSDGFLVDWEAFTGYNEIPWAQLLKERPTKVDTSLRVVAGIDDYYNYQFTEDKYTCFRIQNRERNQSMFAYAPKKGWVELELRKFLSEKINMRGVGSAMLSLIQIKVRFPEEPTPEPIAEITAFLAPNWFTIDPNKDESDMVSPRAIVGAGSDDEMPLKRSLDGQPLAPDGSWK